MNIVILVMSYHTINFFRPLIKKMLANGHNVRILAKYELPFGAKEDKFDTHRVHWDKFEWDRIEDFNPDTIVVFNGYFRPIHAATSILKKKYRTLLMEVAWFSQNDYVYIDEGIHHNSSIAQRVEQQRHRTDLDVVLPKFAGHIRDLKEKYAPIDVRPPEFEDTKPNIVIPLQLERDTSILYASPYFKDMGSLVGFVANNLPDANIIVKCHPKLQTDELEEKIGAANFPGVKFVLQTDFSMNDYAFYADMIIGINSTSLMEAKIHNKPVYQMGCNIFQVEANPPHKEDLVRFFQTIMQGDHKENIQQNEIALLTMLCNQVDFRDPPNWAYRLIVEGALPRTIGSLNEWR